MNELKILYYRRSGSLRQPVQEYLLQLPTKERSILRRRILGFHYYPHSFFTIYGKHITGKIWELRLGRHRIFYTLHKNFVVLLHAFFKKAQKTPHREIRNALRNLHDYLTQPL